MSQVIENLLRRSNKRAPFFDGRKIVLVLPGGTMAGVNGAGAVVALEELGLTEAFDTVYTASAGFPNASYFLSQNTKIGASIYYENLNKKKFINLFRFWKPINYEVLIKAIRDIKPINTLKIWENKTDLFVKLDKNLKETKYVNIKEFSPSEYFEILNSAVSFPIISKGGSIRDHKFFDGEVTKKDHRDFLLKVTNSDYTDILIIYNLKRQKIINFENDKRVLEIFPDKDIGIFETRANVLRNSREVMTKKILNLFNKLSL